MGFVRTIFFAICGLEGLLAQAPLPYRAQIDSVPLPVWSAVDTLFCGPADDTFFRVALPFDLPLPTREVVSYLDGVDGLLLAGQHWQWHFTTLGFFNLGLDVVFVDSAACLLQISVSDSLCLRWHGATAWHPDSVLPWRLSWLMCWYADGRWMVHIDTPGPETLYLQQRGLLIGSGRFDANYMWPMEGVYVRRDSQGWHLTNVPGLLNYWPGHLRFRFTPEPTWTTTSIPETQSKQDSLFWYWGWLWRWNGRTYEAYDLLGRRVKRRMHLSMPP